MKHYSFLAYVKNYVTENPEVAARVTEYITEGVTAALKQSNSRAADMETALVMALNPKIKRSRNVILEKLKAWQGKYDAIAKMEMKK